MKSPRPFLLTTCLGLCIAILVGPAFNIRWLNLVADRGAPIGVEVAWNEPSSASAKGNDNEVNCKRYDDNENFEVGPNLIMTLARRFCIADRDAREVEQSAGGQVEGRADPFPGTSVQSITVTQGLARSGRETAIAQAGDRVVVRVFPSLGRDVTITIRNVDATGLPPTPGPPVGGFTFRIEADDKGTLLSTLPAEVRLSTVYVDADIAGLDEQRLNLAWLDSATNQWVDAPKQAADPKNNYLSASVTKMGPYTIYQR